MCDDPDIIFSLGDGLAFIALHAHVENELFEVAIELGSLYFEFVCDDIDELYSILVDEVLGVIVTRHHEIREDILELYAILEEMGPKKFMKIIEHEYSRRKSD